MKAGITGCVFLQDLTLHFHLFWSGLGVRGMPYEAVSMFHCRFCSAGIKRCLQTVLAVTDFLKSKLPLASR